MIDGHVLLAMRSITKEFPGVKALDGVTMNVRRGDIHAICGENGAGKSTLMKVLSGVYPHGTYDGDIELEGEVMHFGGIKASEERGVVIIHQELALIPELSVTENLFLGSEVTSGLLIDWQAARLKALDLLARVGLDLDPDTPIKTLGVGQQQLIEIAKALAKNVKLLILDEPTSALNEDDSRNLLDLMRGLKAKGITQIMISHKLNEIAAVSDAVTVIRDGRTVETYDVVAGQVTRTGSSARWWVVPSRTATPHAPLTSETCSSRSRAGTSSTPPSRGASSSRTRRSTCAPARWWASPG